MLNSKKSIILILLLLLCRISFSNPVFVNYINEFGFTESGWKIELRKSGFSETLGLDSLYLTSTSDTAYFKEGISLLQDYLIITPDSLKSELSINNKNDTISLYGPDDDYLRGFIFFNESSFPSPPDIGRSICLVNEGIGIDFYIDNSPTFDYANDTTDTWGEAIVQITDSTHTPLEDIFVWENHVGNLDNTLNYTKYIKIGTTDMDGSFSINGMSGFHYYWLNNKDTISDYGEGYIKRVPIFPDSTVYRTEIVGFSLSAGESSNSPGIISKYKLSDNYPNPFNSSTFFTYQIPIDDYVEINLYDIRGRLIKNLESGFKTAGKYKVDFVAKNLNSGIFFYRLETGNKTITKKCMYVK
ncbi:MAG TPA: T9SS type A sorting domain-containing protein [bacterium]|nr:T9SS type A sorting domain-containing protein [bacterium]